MKLKLKLNLNGVGGGNRIRLLRIWSNSPRLNSVTRRWNSITTNSDQDHNEDKEKKTPFRVTDFKIMQDSWQARELFQCRTHHCHNINEQQLATEVILCGWVTSVRKLSNKLIFLTIRDHTGTTQCVVGEASGETTLTTVENCTPETVVSLRGRVQRKQPLPNQPDNSEVETFVHELQVVSSPQGPLPFAPSNLRDLPREEIRLHSRYLDLRRPELQRNLQIRSDCARLVRETLNGQDFQEIETPLLFKPTPEGAREFVVPTRSGMYYALPQSPQQYKQLLMASGVNRYFQIAKCFRDEDHRSDRQPEFTQVDMELSYATPAKVMEVAETLVKRLWREVRGIDMVEPFPILPYRDAMSQYGSDKPDLRGGHLIADVTSTMVESAPFLTELLPGFRLQVLHLRSTPDKTPSFNAMKKWIKEQSLDIRLLRPTNLIFPPPSGGTSDDQVTAWQAGLAEIVRQLSPGAEDFVAFEINRGPFHGAWTGLGRLRIHWLSHLSLPSEFKFLWVTQFPLLAPVAAPSASVPSSDDHPVDYTAYAPVHHPFTSPVPEDFPLLFTHPDQVRAEHYDLVLNGIEIGGGSIRIHDPHLQAFMFKEVMQMTSTGLHRFDHLLAALRAGCPPHGGIALGFDRLVALLCHTSNLRDVIAFPKSPLGRDLTVNSPAPL